MAAILWSYMEQSYCLSHMHNGYCTANHMVTLMCTDHAEWPCQIRRPIWLPLHSVSHRVKKRPDSPLNFLVQDDSTRGGTWQCIIASRLCLLSSVEMLGPTCNLVFITDSSTEAWNTVVTCECFSWNDHWLFFPQKEFFFFDLCTRLTLWCNFKFIQLSQTSFFPKWCYNC